MMELANTYDIKSLSVKDKNKRQFAEQHFKYQN